MKLYRRTRRSGFTMLEALLAVALLAIVAHRGLMAFRSVTEVSTVETSDLVLEDQARTVLQRVAYAIMGSNRESLNPIAEAPLSNKDMQFKVQLGTQDGEVIWSDPEMVGLEELQQQVFWSQNPEMADERRVVWTNLVRPFLEGELPNGMDDNGNGLIDEKGLSFTVDRDSVTIRLTLDRVTNDGRNITKTVETTVTCRNLLVEDLE